MIGILKAILIFIVWYYIIGFIFYTVRWNNATERELAQLREIFDQIKKRKHPKRDKFLIMFQVLTRWPITAFNRFVNTIIFYMNKWR